MKGWTILSFAAIVVAIVLIAREGAWLGAYAAVALIVPLVLLALIVMAVMALARRSAS
jgi:hypothetical protein